jgi:hypothetical protein
MAEHSLPTAGQISTLPRWAIVAFAARCARRVLPLVLRSTLDDQHKSAITKAVEMAEGCAANATHPGFAYPAAAAAIAVNASNIAAVRSAAPAAAAAAVASVAAAASTHTMAADAADAADAAARAVGPAAVHIIINDFNLLRNKARAEGWTNDTKVPPSVFGEMWPEGAPDWANIVLSAKPARATWHANEGSISLTPATNALAFDLWIDPGDASKETLTRLLTSLSELHIAAGGTGMEFIPGDDAIHIRERIPA